nr:esterase-like activity of phytase family protein [Sulfitobacter algicola]
MTASASWAEMNFNRIASFETALNNGDDVTKESSAEIIAATADGMTLVYTDGPLGVIGMIDISDPASPIPLGNIPIDGEPASVSVTGNQAFVAVNTSNSYTAPSGYVVAFDLATRVQTGRCDLGGQPDAVAVAQDGTFLSVAIENERDEDAGDGRTGQMPAGMLLMIDIANGALQCGSLRTVDLTGLAAVSPEDPEPEYVDINTLGETVVSLQENNHIVVVARDDSIISHFSAGAVDLEQVDLIEEGALLFNQSQPFRVREPDAVKWIDDMHFATANEGDMDGGSRSWTIFHKDGDVVYESGTSFEHAIIQIGHYPEERSGNKGIEPESIETAIFNGTPIAFVGAERASVVGVYDISDLASPVLTQLLPSGIGPEGFVAIPDRNLLISANEADLGPDGGIRSHVMIFEYGQGTAAYPMLTSEGLSDASGAPIGWGAISGMVADSDGMIYAVNDSFYGQQPTIFKIDPSVKPARIIDAIRVTRDGAPAQKLDLEGITLDGEGGFWLASEGRTDRVIPHALYHVNADGQIEQEIGLPTELMSVEKRFGFEGITKIGDTLWLAVQREWRDDPDNHVKLVAYHTDTKEWGAVHYQKAQPEKGWVGLSEITAFGDYVYVVERDNQIGTAAVTKKIYRIALSEMIPAGLGGDLPVVNKEIVRDLLPDLKQLNGYVQDKVEGLAILPNGQGFVSTDNDGVDDHSGETLFFSIGQM